MSSNQIFHYTGCITPKRVTSLRDPSPRHCARATQLLSKKCRNGGNTACWQQHRWQHCNGNGGNNTVGNTASNLTGLRFELQTSRSKDESVTARQTGRS